MAIAAELTHIDGLLFLDVAPDSSRPRVANDPDARSWPFYFFYDDEELAHGARQFVALEVLDPANITDYWLAELDKLDLPRVDVPEAGLTDASVADVLRWARETFPSRYSSATA